MKSGKKSSSPHFSPVECRRRSSHFSARDQKRRRNTVVRDHQRLHQKRVIFIGQAPGPRCDPDASSALAGVAEKRIARLSGLHLKELWKRCDRRNILREYPGRRNPSHSSSGVGIVFDSTGTNELTRYRMDPSVHYSTGDEFPLAEAQAAAAALECSGALRPYKLAVLLGLGVARAFGIEQPKFFKLLSPSGAKGMKVLVFPHPSGVSHFWNSAENRVMASKVIRGALRSALGPVRYDAPRIL